MIQHKFCYIVYKIIVFLLLVALPDSAAVLDLPVPPAELSWPSLVSLSLSSWLLGSFSSHSENKKFTGMKCQEWYPFDNSHKTIYDKNVKDFKDD